MFGAWRTLCISLYRCVISADDHFLVSGVVSSPNSDNSSSSVVLSSKLAMNRHCLSEFVPTVVKLVSWSVGVHPSCTLFAAISGSSVASVSGAVWCASSSVAADLSSVAAGVCAVFCPSSVCWFVSAELALVVCAAGCASSDCWFGLF